MSAPLLLALLLAGRPPLEPPKALPLGPCMREETFADFGLRYLEPLEALLLGESSVSAGSAGSADSLRALVLPAFEPEWAIDLRMAEGFLEYRAAEKQLWAAVFEAGVASPPAGARERSDEGVTVPVRVHRHAVSEQTLSLLRRVWHRALEGPREPEERGEDGTVHRFSTSDGRCGETWSPPKASGQGRLVALTERLRELAMSEGEAGAALEQEIRRLAVEWLGASEAER